MEPVVEISDLTKKYGEFTALDGVSLEIGRGQILGLIGHNGAGKSTTIRILAGQSRPTSGKAIIAGVDCVAEFKKIKRVVGYMPDVFGAYDNMRVHEYLDFFGAAFSVPRRERVQRVQAALELTRAAGLRDRFVESLSHGMKQRVAIARTLMHDPQVMILDEPANGLDPQARVEMRELLRQLADQGKTLIVSSHILAELARICDVAAILAQGRLRAFGRVDDILSRLKQRRMMEVQLARADCVEPARRLIAQWLASQGATNEADLAASSGEQAVRFYTTLNDARLSELLGALATANTGVCQFREVEADLEEAFLAITKAPAATPEAPGTSERKSRAQGNDASCRA